MKGNELPDHHGIQPPLVDRLNRFHELCAVCRLTLGAHRADSTHMNQCPTHEGRMDWPADRISTFVASGFYERVPYGTLSAVFRRGHDETAEDH